MRHSSNEEKLNQWYFKITEYADRLLDDMAQLEGKWPEKVLTMQRNWIGRSTGANVQFVIEGKSDPVTIYTTRPDTLFGATFFVVAADSPLAEELASSSTPDVARRFHEYLESVKSASDIDRLATDRPKTGIFWSASLSIQSMERNCRSGRVIMCLLTMALVQSWPCRRMTNVT